MPGLLQNHIAVVTGAGSGIGRAIALGYAREGAQVVVLDINGEAAAATAADIRKAGGKADELHARCHRSRRLPRHRRGDRRKSRPGLDPRQQCRHQPPQRLHRRCRRRDQGLAGHHGDQPQRRVQRDARLSRRRCAPAKGRIVNIGSIQSFMHVRTPNSAAYTTSKHGVLGFTRALAAELGKDGVRVNAIGPGLIETPLNAKVRANNPELVKIFHGPHAARPRRQAGGHRRARRSSSPPIFRPMSPARSSWRTAATGRSERVPHSRGHKLLSSRRNRGRTVRSTPQHDARNLTA